MRRSVTLNQRIGLRQLLIVLSLAGIVPMAIVSTVLLVVLWRDQQAELQAALAGLLVLVLGASGVFAWLIGRRLADSIHAAADAAAAMAAGQSTAPVPSRIAEVQMLSAAIERSFARLAVLEAERRRAEGERDKLLEQESRARREAEAASRAKDEFLAMLGHELRNPLGAIGNAVRVIERLPSGSADAKTARDIIARQTAQLAKIIDDLLDVGRLVSGKISLQRNLVDLSRAAAAAVAVLRTTEGADQHAWQLDLQPVLVSADPTRLDQVLANLLGNAAKFTPRGKAIGVSVGKADSEALLRIADEGVGIRRELLPQIFELFTQDDAAVHHAPGGLGIGLTLAKRIVELHGGSLAIDSPGPGRGATVTVRLPAIPEPEVAAARPRRDIPARQPRQARILIVEDHDDARISLQRVLQADGHLVSVAVDARAGLEAALAGSPNIAIIDIGLPGADGYSLARSIRERLGAGVRLIALTGYGMEADRKRSADAGFDAHLTKPVDFVRLSDLIAEAP
jgi:signal transduction histidine kinase